MTIAFGIKRKPRDGRPVSERYEPARHLANRRSKEQPFCASGTQAFCLCGQQAFSLPRVDARGQNARVPHSLKGCVPSVSQAIGEILLAKRRDFLLSPVSIPE